MLVKMLNLFPSKVGEAGDSLSPSVIANYCFDVAKEFNQYYHDTQILKESDEVVRRYRLALISSVAKVLRTGMGLLGIELPERM